MLLKDLANSLDRITEKDSQYAWDNSGLLVGDLSKKIRKVLVTLEITPDVLQEAEEKDIDLIVSHHPIIFSGKKKLVVGSDTFDVVYELIRLGIAAYATHTNFDMLNNGLNDYFLDVWGVQDREILSDEEGKPIGRVFSVYGDNTILDIAKHIKDIFKLPEIRIIGDKFKKVTKVGVVTGSGIDVLFGSDYKEIDLSITGDVKYHQAHDILQKGKNVIDAGHFGTENIFPDAFLSLVKNKITEIEFIKSEINVNPFQYLE